MEGLESQYKTLCMTLVLMNVFIKCSGLDFQLASVSSHYDVRSVLDTINDDIVTNIYQTTNSVVECSIKCATVSSPSFYFKEQTVMCYCNNQRDSGVIVDEGPGSVLYGYLTKEFFTETSGSDQHFTTTTGNYSRCSEIADAGFTADGLYKVYTSTGIVEEQYCAFPSGGWTVFQRRANGNVNFFRSWTEYVNGFGNYDGEFWLGLESLYNQVKGGGCQLLIYLEAEENDPVREAGYALYANFTITGASDNYRLHTDGFTGNVGNALDYQNGNQFSTYDRDNDMASYSCADAHKGGWWYNSCHSSNLNGLYLGGAHTSYADGIGWGFPWGNQYSLLRSDMMFRCQDIN